NTVSPPRSLTTMQPFFRELSVNRETALALMDGLAPSQLSWRPGEAQWGLAEICSHLATITNLYLPAIDEAVRQGHADAAYSDRPFQGNVVSRLLVWSMEPPVRIRMRSPRALRPRPAEDPVVSRQAYRSAQGALELRLERAAGLDLAHVRVRPPTMRGVRLALGTVLALLLAHERRHLWQGTVIRKSPAFPAA
ncbi:MAG TPA: DinB family protein, partial [Gemmatimonadaceae bacterium]|nr:DinB family protein [Gemmatimonadaceae bacterium]